MIMFFGTSAFGRIDLKTKEFRNIELNESILNYFENTVVLPELLYTEIGFSVYFISDVLLRCFISPNRFVFFTDTINWIDIIATVSSAISVWLYNKPPSGLSEAYIISLKIPRVFRLFKLTPNLKNGMDAITLTIRASTNDLLLVFLIVMVFVLLFGVLIFVVELVNEVNQPSKFTSIIVGMWWAIVTMATVGYGDCVPETQGGYVVGFTCIICGIIISQLPVPIFLRNFSIYYAQAKSRLGNYSKAFNISTDPENLREALNCEIQILKDSNKLHSKRFLISR